MKDGNSTTILVVKTNGAMCFVICSYSKYLVIIDLKISKQVHF